jgi:hypothetical protein
LWDPEKSWQTPDFGKGPKEIPDPLYYAALLDVRDAVKVLVDTRAVKML